MTRTAADSTVAAYLPEGMDLYLGYIDGNYRSYDQIRARFPGKLVVPIATQPSGDVGIVGDGPPDNGTWPEWVGWVVRRRRAGVDPTINTNGSHWAAGVTAFNQAGVAQPHWWIAEWNDHAVMIPGAIGHQYQSVPNRYDLSVFADYWPGVDPAPHGTGGGTTGTTPTPPGHGTGATPQIARVKDMILLEVENAAGTGKDVYLLSGDVYVHVPDGPTFTALKAAGIPAAVVSNAFGQGIEAAITALVSVTAPTPGRTVTSTV